MNTPAGGSGLLRIRVARGAEAKDFIDFADDGEGFLFGELAVNVFHRLEDFADRGAGGEVFFDIGGFAGGAGQGLDEAGEGAGIAAQEIIEVSGFGLAEGEDEPGDGQFEGPLIEFGGIEVVEQIESGFLFGAEVFNPFLLKKPVLVVRTGVPVGEVARGDMQGLVAEPGRDFIIGDAVAEQEVKLVADGLGEAADFAMGTVDAGSGQGFGSWRLNGRLRRGRSLVFDEGVHRIDGFSAFQISDFRFQNCELDWQVRPEGQAGWLRIAGVG